MGKTMMNFSIIIPAFNEGHRLPAFLKDLSKELTASRWKGEIIVVDDGSRLSDVKIYQELISSLPHPQIKYVRLDPNQGKGAAIKHGFKQALGEWVGFADADGSTSASEVLRLAQIATESSVDGVFGSRVKMLGYHIERKLIRHVTGRIFITWVSCILHVSVYDSQCGCKFFRKNKVMGFIDRCKEKGFLLDLELIVLGLKNNLKYIEVPIHWKEIPGSKVNILTDGIKMFWEILRIKRHLK